MPIADVRSYVAGTFQLKLDGVEAGFVKSVDGGAITAEVINEAVGPTAYVKKHVGPPRYEDFSIDIGLWMARTVYDWIQASLKMNYQRKNGSIVLRDRDGSERVRWNFVQAWPAKWTGPALMAEGNDIAIETLELAHEGLVKA